MGKLKGKTVLITGSTRGIGRAIALKCASDGANIVITGKTDAPHPKLPGTIHSVAEEVTRGGGTALALRCDVRVEEEVIALVDAAGDKFGGLDVVINNAGAIFPANTEATPMKRYDLMLDINMRAVFLLAQKAIPFLRKAANPHILSLAPPLNRNPKWFQNHLAYTLSKYGMTLATLGLAHELKEEGIAANTLWPRTIIATSAIDMLMGKEGRKQCRKPEIMADAAYAIITKNAREVTGQTFIDEEILKRENINDFTRYAVEEGETLMPDLFIDEAFDRY